MCEDIPIASRTHKVGSPSYVCWFLTPINTIVVIYFNPHKLKTFKTIYIYCSYNPHKIIYTYIMYGDSLYIVMYTWLQIVGSSADMFVSVHKPETSWGLNFINQL